VGSAAARGTGTGENVGADKVVERERVGCRGWIHVREREEG